MARMRPWMLAGITAAGLAAGGVAVAMVPVTTRQGVNFHVSEQRLPLRVKLLGFLHRHWEYQLLARDITRGRATDEQRASAVLAWTHERIRPTPAGWPIVDDHILHIIIRGHGKADQIADVFTTLATYAGVDAFWKAYESGEESAMVWSFAKLDGRWVACDASAGLLVRGPDGAPAGVDELAAHPDWLALPANRGVGPGARAVLDQLTRFEVPQPLRAKSQMPGPRLRSELQRLGKR